MEKNEKAYIKFFSNLDFGKAATVLNIGITGSELEFLELSGLGGKIKRLEELAKDEKVDLVLFLDSFHKHFPYKNLINTFNAAKKYMKPEAPLLFKSPVSGQRLFEKSISSSLHQLSNAYLSKNLFIIGKGNQGRECIENYLIKFGDIDYDISENQISSFDALADPKHFFINAGSPQDVIFKTLKEKGIKDSQVISFFRLKQLLGYSKHVEAEIDPQKNPLKRRIWPAYWFSFFFYDAGFKDETISFFDQAHNGSEIASLLRLR